MDHSKFQKLLSDLGWLSPTQKQQAIDVLLGESQASASLTAIEARVAEKRQCPHCNTPGAVSHGMGRGLRRYRCKAVEKLATMPHQEAIRRLSLTHPSDCCNSFSSSNDGKANRDDLRGNDSDDSALLLGREEGHQGDLSSP